VYEGHKDEVSLSLVLLRLSKSFGGLRIAWDYLILKLIALFETDSFIRAAMGLCKRRISLPWHSPAVTDAVSQNHRSNLYTRG
jgi:hypothetical protein